VEEARLDSQTGFFLFPRQENPPIALSLTIQCTPSQSRQHQLHEPIKEKDRSAENQSKTEDCLNDPKECSNRPPSQAVKPA